MPAITRVAPPAIGHPCPDRDALRVLPSMGIRHLPAVDGLRAVAVLAVVAYHAGFGGAGYVGVDIFFVISGYLITRILREDGSLATFYARRARRILPAACVVVAATLAFSMLLLPAGAGEVAKSAAAAGVFGANVWFQHATADYWAPASESMPLLHLWSLSVEEQFYVAWPFLLLLRRRWMVFVAIVSFVLAEVLIARNPSAAFFQMPARAWELAAGGLVALYAPRVRHAGGIGSMLLVLAVLVPFPHFPAAGALPAVVGAALIVAAAHHGERIAWLELRPMVGIGLVSYSLYLWHWPLLAIDRATRIGDAPLSARLALCGAAFLLAILTYRYVETPFRRAQVRPLRALAGGVACVVALSTAAFALADTPSRKPVVAKPLACAPWGNGVRTDLQPRHCALDAPKVMIWGDSHARAWSALALEIAEREGKAAVYFGVDACPPYLGEPMQPADPARTQGCIAHNRETLAYLETYGADTLILTARWPVRAREQPDWPAKFVALVREVSPRVRRIIVIGPTPEMRDDVPKCVALGESCAVSRAEFERSLSTTDALLAQLAEFPNVEVVHPSDWLCDATLCPDVRNGAPLYSDRHHLTSAAVDGWIAAQWKRGVR